MLILSQKPCLLLGQACPLWPSPTLSLTSLASDNEGMNCSIHVLKPPRCGVGWFLAVPGLLLLKPANCVTPLMALYQGTSLSLGRHHFTLALHRWLWLWCWPAIPQHLPLGDELSKDFSGPKEYDYHGKTPFSSLTAYSRKAGF